MPHKERPKVGEKVTICAQCQTQVKPNERAFYLIEGITVHYGCYFIYRRLHPNGDRVA